jgi:hypothetical protein
MASAKPSRSVSPQSRLHQNSQNLSKRSINDSFQPPAAEDSVTKLQAGVLGMRSFSPSRKITAEDPAPNRHHRGSLSLADRLASYKKPVHDGGNIPADQTAADRPKLNPLLAAKLGDIAKATISRMTKSAKKKSKVYRRTTIVDNPEVWYLICLDSVFKRSWETAKFVLLMYQFFYLPLMMTFLGGSPPLGLYIFDKSIDFIFFIDIIFTFFTQIYLKYDKVNDLKTIAKEYLRHWFVVDVMSVFPFEEMILIMSEEPIGKLALMAQILRLLRFFRLAKLIKLFRTFDFKNNDNYLVRMLEGSLSGTAFWLLLPNFLLITLVMHLFSCIWYALALANSTNDSWIELTNFQDESLFDLYIISLYFVVQTFTTTGYGDILSSTKTEQAFRILMMILAVLLYGLFSGQVVNYRSQKMEQEERLALKLQKLEEINAHYKLDEVLHNYLKERLRENKGVVTKKEHDLSQIPKEEKDELDYYKIVSKYSAMPMFRTKNNDQEYNASVSDFQLKLGRILKKKFYRAGQIVYTKDEASVLFYLIGQGSVVVMKDDIASIPMYIIKSGYFGETEIINSCNRLHTIMANEDSIIYYIESIEFKRIFMEDNELYDHVVKISKWREGNIAKANSEMDFFIRRKLFWKMILKGHSRKQKKEFNKMMLKDQYRHSKSSRDKKRADIDIRIEIDAN